MKIQKKVEEVFLECFSRTPLRQRIDDITKEAIELGRYTDFKNLREEAGDLLASVLMLCNECEWDAEELIQKTLNKIISRKHQYQTLGRKTIVAIFGGAFNPVTNGHIETAKFVLNTSKIFDEVWIMPCYQHMYGKKLESPEVRLEMLHEAVKVDGRIKVFDYEIRNQFKGDSYNFVKRLQEDSLYKDTHNFSFIMGMDNANTFDQWVNHEELEKLIRFVIVPRKGIQSNSNINWYLQPPHIYLSADSPISEISSTDVRKAVKEKNADFLAKNIPFNVYAIIKEKRLYED